MPCIDVNPMLDALEERVVDPRKVIAQVWGAGQAGCSLWIERLTEKLWMTDTLYFGMWGFVSVDNHEPTDGPIEIKIYPCIIPSGMYQNIKESPANGTTITRGPICQQP